MASRRMERVEELLRRELADMLLRGELRDPRLKPAMAISITGARVTADLSVARVFVDVLTDEADIDRVLAGLNAGRSALRAKLGQRVKLRRTPELRFERDDSVIHGARIEAVLAELADERREPQGTPDEGGAGDEAAEDETREDAGDESAEGSS